MRPTLLLAILVLSATALGGGASVAPLNDVQVWPVAGRSIDPAAAPADIRIVFRGAASDVVLLDAEARPVAAEVQAPTISDRVIVPAARLEPGQYSVDFPDLQLTRSFTVGPDVYAPRLLSVTPENPKRGSTLAIRFTEPVKAATVSHDSVKVFEVTDTGLRRVAGRLWLDQEGTRVTYTPVGWPGFTPEATFVVVVGDETTADTGSTDVGSTGDNVVTDVADNVCEPITVTVVGDVGVDEVVDTPPVPQAVYWSSDTELGVLAVGGASFGPFPAKSVRVGDPKEIVLDPRVDVDGNGVAYGLNPRRNEVLVMHARTGEILQRIPVRSPAGVAIHPTGESLFVSSKKDGRLLVFDTTGAQTRARDGVRLVAEIGVGRKPAGVAVSPDGRYVACVSARDRTVTVLSARTLSTVSRPGTERRPEDLAFVRTEDGNEVLLVTCRGRGRSGGSVLAFDVECGRRLATVAGLSRPRRLTAVDGCAFVAEERANSVAIIEVADDGRAEVVRRVDAGRRPVDVTPSPEDAETLFVVNRRRSRLSVVSLAEGRVVNEVDAPGAIAVASWGER